MTTPAADVPHVDPLAIRPPQQRRSREAWTRVLDEGVALLEEGGYEAFTIAAVCDRAQVAPRALYARAETKDALFLAVYEHGIARVRATQSVFTRPDRWAGLSTDALVADVVREMAGIFGLHGAFLRSVVLISGGHPEVYRRGAIYAQELNDQVTAVLLSARDDIDHADPERAVRSVLNAVFSTLVLRTAYGPTFATLAVDDTEDFLASLTEMVQRYLFVTPR